MRLLVLLLLPLLLGLGLPRALQARHHQKTKNPETHHLIRHGEWLKLLEDDTYSSLLVRRSHKGFISGEPNWPIKHEAVVEGDLVLGGLMMVHEREDSVTCGPVMPQGGIQALEAMLFTLDKLNTMQLIPGVKIGAHILDDCDKDTYGLEMAVDFIKGKFIVPFSILLFFVLFVYSD